MKQGAESKAVGFNLEFLPEPAMLVGLDGRISSVNSAGRRFIDAGCETPNLFDIVSNTRADVEAFLRRASGSTSSHMGTLEVRCGAQVERFRAMAARAQLPDQDRARLILRLMPSRNDQFSVLNNRVREIDHQLRQRRKENALLHEALDGKRVLVRELQHRVKNNIQQMLSLINFAAANRSSPEVTDLVSAAGSRLRAMAATQQAIYQSDGAASLPACGFLGDIARGVADSFGGADRLHLSIEDVLIPEDIAHSIALIANELATNAFKYGNGQVSVRFRCSADSQVLEVQDEGCGFDERSMSRSSGLTLVRSLCRQIGGKLHIANDMCCSCSVQYWTKAE